MFLCCTTQPRPSLWRGLWVFLLEALPLAELILFGELPSCLPLFIGEQLGNKIEQSVTANQRVSQEAEPRVRVKHGAEGVYLCVIVEIICVFATACCEGHKKS